MKTPLDSDCSNDWISQHPEHISHCTLFTHSMIMRVKMLKVRVKMLMDVVLVMRVVMEMSVE